MDRRSLKRLEALETEARERRFGEALAGLRTSLDALSPEELGEWVVSCASAHDAGYVMLPEEPPVVTFGFKRWREIGGLEAFAEVEAACVADAKTTTRPLCNETFTLSELGITGERSRAVSAALRELSRSGDARACPSSTK